MLSSWTKPSWGWFILDTDTLKKQPVTDTGISGASQVPVLPAAYPTAFPSIPWAIPIDFPYISSSPTPQGSKFFSFACSQRNLNDTFMQLYRNNFNSISTKVILYLSCYYPQSSQCFKAVKKNLVGLCQVFSLLFWFHWSVAQMLTHRIFNAFPFCIHEIPNTMFEQRQKDVEINPVFVH